jgi:HD superfamily phosphodiesterase
MKRVNEILRDETYNEYLQKIERLEDDRIFCRHDLPHFLDVCRIAWILNLEQGLNLDRELIYAAGLLHDIGRWVQYETGEKHDLASERLSGAILDRCGFTEDEIAQIKKAIRNHRKLKDGDILCRIIFESDKLSRNCFCCPAAAQCKKHKAEDWLYV